MADSLDDVISAMNNLNQNLGRLIQAVAGLNKPSTTALVDAVNDAAAAAAGVAVGQVYRNGSILQIRVT